MELKKFLDAKGLAHLWKQIDIENYPTYDVLSTVVNLIDEQKQNKIPSFTVNVEDNDEGNILESGLYDFYLEIEDNNLDFINLTINLFSNSLSVGGSINTIFNLKDSIIYVQSNQGTNFKLSQMGTKENKVYFRLIPDYSGSIIRQKLTEEFTPIIFYDNNQQELISVDFWEQEKYEQLHDDEKAMLQTEFFSFLFPLVFYGIIEEDQERLFILDRSNNKINFIDGINETLMTFPISGMELETDPETEEIKVKNFVIATLNMIPSPHFDIHTISNNEIENAENLVYMDSENDNIEGEEIKNVSVNYIPQLLTDEQKAQARQNIGAVGAEYMINTFTELKNLIASQNTDAVIALLDQAILDLAILA